jgi:hypothetical protein
VKARRLWLAAALLAGTWDTAAAGNRGERVDDLRFSERVLDLLEKELVPESVFEQAVFPTYDWNTAFAERFDAPEVQRFLQRVLASPAVGAQRKQIVKEEILTGNARKDVLELREAGEIR